MPRLTPIRSRAIAAALVASALTSTPALAAAHGEAGASVTGGSAVVTAGGRAFVDATLSRHWCRVELAGPTGARRGPVRHVSPRKVRLLWSVPTAARSGRYRVGLRCGASKRTAKSGRLASMSLRVRGGMGTHPIVDVNRLRARAVGGRVVSEHLRLNDALPPGVGDPSLYAVSLPPGVGGGDFASYWPLANGARARITEGPGGRYSHYTIYTHDAVDLGLATGTEIRASFIGVVARVNNGCSVGNRGCGNGYGNYVYLKASDGTCAVMAHLSRIVVAPGQQLQIYDLIGLSGNSGNSTGPHLHYDRVNCSNNRSLPWAPLEGGPLNEGRTIVSQNHATVISPPGQPGTPGTNPGGTNPGGTTPVTPPPPNHQEQQGHHGVNTFTNFHNASGMGPRIEPGQWVEVSCKVYEPTIVSVNPDGYWYRIASAPWNDQYYSPANTFMNGDPWDGPYTHNTDFSVPDC